MAKVKAKAKAKVKVKVKVIVTIGNLWGSYRYPMGNLWLSFLFVSIPALGSSFAAVNLCLITLPASV